MIGRWWRRVRCAMPEWWEWPIVQWWWWRQYKWADRRAFRRECAEIKARSSTGP